MTKAAQPKRGYGKRIKDSVAQDKKLFSLYRRLDSPVDISVTGSAGGSGGSEVGSVDGYLKTAGDTMIGPIAFFPRALAITTGEIDIGMDTDYYSSRVIVSPQSGSTDDLDTITGAAFAGQLLFLQGVAGNTITLKTTGNIETIRGEDFPIADDDVIILQYDTTDTKWQQITVGKQTIVNGKSFTNLDLDGNILILDADNDTFLQSDGDDNYELTVGGAIKMQSNNTQITFYDTLGMNNNPVNNISSLGFQHSGTITSVTTGLEYDVTTSDKHLFKYAGSNRFSIENSSCHILNSTLDMNANALDNVFRINGANSGWIANNTGVNDDWTINMGATTDDFIIIYNNDTDTKWTIGPNHVITTSDGQAYTFESTYDDSTPADDTIMALYQWNYPNLAGTLHTYVQMEIQSFDVSNGTEDGMITWKLIGSGEDGAMQFTMRPDSTGSATPIFEIYENDSSPGTGDIGQIQWFANDSADSKVLFAEIDVEADDITTGDHDAAMKLRISESGGMHTVIEINGDNVSNEPRLGFFGATPVTQPVLSASPTTTQISTVLHDLGLVD